MGRDIDLKVSPISDYTEAPEGGILITNPPYGERISADDMDALYASIGSQLKNVFKNYHAWIIGMKKECFDKIGLKPSRKIPMLNGALECEFREYEVFDGTYAEFRKQGRALRGEAPKPRPMRKKREDDEESRPPRRWKSQDDGHRSRRDFKREKDSDGWEKDRHGVKRRKAKNPLEERYHKPYSERRRDFNDEKVRKNVRLKMPKLFDESEWGETEVVMRHRNRKDNKD